MNLFYILLFGTVQGLTEFLPVSSTGHLIILERLLNVSPLQYGFSFDVALHLGTLIALLVFFKKTLLKIVFDAIHKKTKLAILILIGTMPAVIAGLFFQSIIESKMRGPEIVAFNLIIFSFVFYIAEKIGKQLLDLKQLTGKNSLFIGIFQTTAFLPGVSRSGITLSGGLFKNLKREQAGEFAFLLSIPIVFLAGVKDIFDLVRSGVLQNYWLTSFLGMLVSAIVGFFCIKYFLRYLKKYSLMPFIIYRIVLGVLILFLLRF